MKIFVCAGLSASLINFRGPLLRDLVAAGHKVVAAGPEKDESTIETLRKWGIQFTPVPLARTGLNPFSDVASLLRLTYLLRQQKPDIFLGYTKKPIIYGLLAAYLARVPRRYALVTGLGFSFIGSSSGAVAKLVRGLYKVSLKFCDRVIFQNPDDRKLFLEERLVAEPQRTAVVNGSGVDLDLFSPAPITLPENREFVFLLIARLISEKGIYEYVDAARKVKASYPWARFQLLGAFENRPGAISPAEVQSWIKEGVIEYLGEQPDVRPYLRHCQVYVLPSYREGTPRTVLEAMAIGRPIITTDVSGCRETVQHGVNGWLVPAQSVEGLRSAMVQALEQVAVVQQMAVQSRHIVREKYDVRMVNRQMFLAMGLA